MEGDEQSESQTFCTFPFRFPFNTVILTADVSFFKKGNATAICKQIGKDRKFDKGTFFCPAPLRFS